VLYTFGLFALRPRFLYMCREVLLRLRIAQMGLYNNTYFC